MPTKHLTTALLTVAMLFPGWKNGAEAADASRWTIKRKGPFSFAQEPNVKRQGDRVEISFATKGACDVTVVVQDDRGRIVRHIASGVLGDQAPAPFKKGSLEQTIVWDCKDDAGKYIDDLEDLSVRVSLGLNPRFERTLFWHPMKHNSNESPIAEPSPEGVYVYFPGSMTHLRLFSHEGDYIRTIYPFSAEKVAAIKGLFRHTFPQDKKTLPIKSNFLQNTLLTVDGVGSWNPITYKPDSKTYESVIGKSGSHFGMYVKGATAMAVRKGRLALASMKVNRLSLNGNGALDFYGPKCAFPGKLRTLHEFRGGIFDISPRSVALSPDGTKLYTAGYLWARPWNHDGLHGVGVQSMANNEKTATFAGSFKGKGSKDGQFQYATCVAVDSKGRVYAGDYMNGRVQVFSPDGKHLKNLPVKHPMHIQIHPKTGHIWVFSWLFGNDVLVYQMKKKKLAPIKPGITVFDSFEQAKKVKTYGLPGGPSGAPRAYHGVCRGGLDYRVALNPYAKEDELWISRRRALTRYVLDGRKWKLKRDFAKEAESVARYGQGAYFRQRLYVNHKRGDVHVGLADSTATGKSFQYLVGIDPRNGKIKSRPLPFHAEDLCFDQHGHAYLRTQSLVVRYDSRTWREVPFDYGEERVKVAFGCNSKTKYANTISALVMPSNANWHHGGINVSLKGNIVVGCLYATKVQNRRQRGSVTLSSYSKANTNYEPTLYPGRLFAKKGTIVHIWNKHGQTVYEDAVPGLGDCYGVKLDVDDNIYVMNAATPLYNGKRYFNDLAGTMMKFAPKQGRVLTLGGAPVKLTSESKPKRKPDLTGAIQGKAWVENAKWMYGGVGYGGKNRGVGCACWNASFDTDFLKRSFVPELDRYSIAVLDTAGNLITRIGRYGNTDNGKPLEKNKNNAVEGARSIGGDEVALFHGAYVASHTDHRLFIADPGNARILSVKLGYHVEKLVKLK